MPSPVTPSLPIDRAALSQFIKDPRTLLAMENALQQALQVTPGQITALQALLDAAQMVISVADPDFPAARVLAGGLGITIDTATAGLIKVLVNVATALGYTPAHQSDVTAIEAADALFATAADVPAPFANGRVLSSAIPGVTIDLGTANIAALKIALNTLLNSDNIVLVQPFEATAGATVAGGLDCDTLRIDQAPTASGTASTHSIPVNINGVVMYMRLSSTP